VILNGMHGGYFGERPFFLGGAAEVDGFYVPSKAHTATSESGTLTSPDTGMAKEHGTAPMVNLHAVLRFHIQIPITDGASAVLRVTLLTSLPL
jgi:hypothetical protein